MELGKETVQAVLADVEAAPIDERLRATLRFLTRVTSGEVTADDVRASRRAGVTTVQLKEALAVAFCFNVIVRLADTFEFDVGSPESFDASAKMLLRRGYES